MASSKVVVTKANIYDALGFMKNWLMVLFILIYLYCRSKYLFSPQIKNNAKAVIDGSMFLKYYDGYIIDWFVEYIPSLADTVYGKEKDKPTRFKEVWLFLIDALIYPVGFFYLFLTNMFYSIFILPFTMFNTTTTTTSKPTFASFIEGCFSLVFGKSNSNSNSNNDNKSKLTIALLWGLNLIFMGFIPFAMSIYLLLIMDFGIIAKGGNACTTNNILLATIKKYFNSLLFLIFFIISTGCILHINKIVSIPIACAFFVSFLLSLHLTGGDKI